MSESWAVFLFIIRPRKSFLLPLFAFECNANAPRTSSNQRHLLVCVGAQESRPVGTRNYWIHSHELRDLGGLRGIWVVAWADQMGRAGIRSSCSLLMALIHSEVRIYICTTVAWPFTHWFWPCFTAKTTARRMLLALISICCFIYWLNYEWMSFGLASLKWAKNYQGAESWRLPRYMSLHRITWANITQVHRRFGMFFKFAFFVGHPLVLMLKVW